MKKQIIALLLVLCMMPCSFTFAESNAGASEITTNASEPSDNVISNFDIVVSNILTTISSYYYAKDVSGSFDANATLETDLAMYLADKVSTQHHIDNLYNLSKENFNIDVNLIDYTASANSNIIIFEIQALATFNYVGRDFDTTVSDVVTVKYDIQKQKIVDIYIPLDYYDEFVRPEHSTQNSLLANTQIDNSEFKLTSSIISKQEELHYDIGLKYNAFLSEEPLANVPHVTRASSLNNTAVVNWARSNFAKNQPSPGNNSVIYFDFSGIPGAYDCTNFVSHALLAGGAKINDTGGSGISSTGWYYRNINNRSSSWSGVDQFYRYMTTNTKANTAYGASYVYSTNGGMWSLGSVLQFDFEADGSFNHSTIITKREQSDGRYYAYVTGRTGDNKYNNNQSVYSMNAQASPRVINVYNR